MKKKIHLFILLIISILYFSYKSLAYDCLATINIYSGDNVIKVLQCNSDTNPEEFYNEDGKTYKIDNNGLYLGGFYSANYIKNNNVCPKGFRIMTKSDYLKIKSILGSISNIINKLKLPLSGIKYDSGIYNEINLAGYLLFPDNTYLSYDNNGTEELRTNWEDYDKIKAPIRCIKETSKENEIVDKFIDCGTDIRIGNFIWKACNIVDPSIPGYDNQNPSSGDKLNRVIGSFYNRKIHDLANVCPSGYTLPSAKDINEAINTAGGIQQFIEILHLPYSGIRYADGTTYAEKDSAGYLHLANPNSYFLYETNGNWEIRENYFDANDVAIPVRCVRKIKNNASYNNNFLIYYGWPSVINNSNGDINKAEKEFAKFKKVVLGRNLQDKNHPDFNNLKKIIQDLKNNVDFYGYVPAVDFGNINLDKIKNIILERKNIGVKGIFIDEAGYDYAQEYFNYTYEEYKNYIKSIYNFIKENDLNVIFNSWNPEDIYNNLLLTSSDGVLIESYYYGDGEDKIEYKNHVNKYKQAYLKTPKGLLFCIATGKSNDKDSVNNIKNDIGSDMASFCHYMTIQDDHGEDETASVIIPDNSINNFDSPRYADHFIDCGTDIRIGSFIWEACNIVDPSIPGYDNQNPSSGDKLNRVIGSFYNRKIHDLANVCPSGYTLPSAKDINEAINTAGGIQQFIEILHLPYSGIRYADGTTYAEKDSAGYLHLANPNSYFLYETNGNWEIRENYFDASDIAIPVRCVRKIENNIENLTDNVGLTARTDLFQGKYPYSDIVECNNITDDHINFLKKFEISELICSSTQEDLEKISNIKEKTGVKALKYDWMAAIPYYKENNNYFATLLYNNWQKYTLNPDLNTKYHEMGDDVLVDLYFDYGNTELINEKSKWWIENELKGIFDGVFFDWAGDGWGKLESPWVEDKFKNLMRTYYDRHPNLPYNQAELNYLNKLKEKKNDIILMTNQGIYADPLPKGVDLDMIESVTTSDELSTEEKNNYCKNITLKDVGVVKACDTWYRNLSDAIAQLSEVESKIKNKYPHLKEILLNYAFPKYKKLSSGEYVLEKNKEAIYYNYAVARLFKNIYSMTDFPAIYEQIDTEYKKYTDQLPFVNDEIYGLDLGNIRGSGYIYLENIKTYLRFYDKGFVLVFNNQQSESITLQITDNNVKEIYDVFNNKIIPVTDNKVNISLSPAISSLTQQKLPIGRVFVYIY